MTQSEPLSQNVPGRAKENNEGPALRIFGLRCSPCDPNMNQELRPLDGTFGALMMAYSIVTI
jgi:hypothetical protein